MFGQTYPWEDGLSVSVSAGASFTPSEYASSDKAPAYLMFVITITNNTGATFDPSMFYATAQSADAEADEVYDTDSGLKGSPSTKLLNGRTSTFNVGFGVKDPKDVVMEVQPGFEYESVIFTTAEAASSIAAPARSDAPEGSVQGSGNPAFGQTYFWPDGLSVNVSAGASFTPSEYASADKAPAYVMFIVTITNETGAVYEPTMFYATVQSGDMESDAVFDSENGITSSPTTKLLNGRKSTFRVGFGVKDPKDVVMEVQPGYDYDSVLFVN